MDALEAPPTPTPHPSASFKTFIRRKKSKTNFSDFLRIDNRRSAEILLIAAMGKKCLDGQGWRDRQDLYLYEG